MQPSRRPADGRFGENPNRLFKHHQFQVILKPAPDEVQQLYLQSLEACGIDLRAHDVRFEEDNWESPTLGAWGIGWQVLFDGQEITQFTYFQQAGGIDLQPISVELTYGLEGGFAMALQDVDKRLRSRMGGWRGNARDVRHRDEVEQSKYAFGQVDMPKAEFIALHRDLFDKYYLLAQTLLRSGLVLPALDYCLKCSHLFNLLDAATGRRRRDRAHGLYPARSGSWRSQSPSHGPASGDSGANDPQGGISCLTTRDGWREREPRRAKKSRELDPPPARSALRRTKAHRQPARRSSKSEGGKRRARERAGESEGRSPLGEYNGSRTTTGDRRPRKSCPRPGGCRD